MKAMLKLFSGFFLGSLLGWFLGFLRLPYIEKNYSFLLGFIACMALLVLVFLLLVTWKKHTTLLMLLRKNPADGDTQSATRTYAIIWILVAVLIVGGGLLSSFLIFQQNRYLKTQLQNQDRKLREQSALIESARKGNMIYLMSNILDNVEEELKNNGSLPDAVIARIAAFSFSLKPYRYLQGDSLSARELSPERGQLLMALLLMKMDSVSFARIKQSVSFAAADLSGAALQQADLSGAQLSSADLKDADLSGADLQHADLQDGNLWGANLNKADLRKANLKRSDLRWAALNGANLQFADLNGAQLSSAQLLQADAQDASVQYADLTNTTLAEAKLTRTNFLGAEMSKANLNNTDLTRSDLRMTNLEEATLTGTVLNSALVDSNWTDKLASWRLTGVKEINDNYQVVSDSLDKWNHKVYRLNKTGKSGSLPAN